MIVRALAVILLVSSACGPVTVQPDSLRIVRESGLAENAFPPLDRTIEGPATAELRRELLALPPKTVDKFCPIDFGMRYPAVIQRQ